MSPLPRWRSHPHPTQSRGEREKIGAEQVAALFRAVTAGVIGGTMGAMVLAGTMVQLGYVAPATAWGWTAYIALCAAVHIWLRRLYERARPDVADWRRWAWRFTWVALAEGIGWGWATIWLPGNGGFEIQLLVHVVTFGVAAGAIPGFSPYLPAFFALFLPTTLPYAIASIGAENPVRQAASLLVFVFIAAVGTLSVTTNRSFRQIVSLRIRTEQMAEDLRVQKEIAEQASLAKSTFLAAASHDLRQPVHALGLFVGALRQIALPPEGRQLVEQIDASTTAMDGLFSALLDISRLDAGIVEVRRRSFAIGPLIARICRDHQREALDKGLTLRCMATAAIVASDPVLVERILRNLVSNAVRHTRRGRILVGCRARGAQIAVQIWDSGPGIAVGDRERIFQEYHQLGNSERDRAKGLGLGLAIVRRLTILLDCPLTLHSEPGHGSCFEIAVPLASDAETIAVERAEAEADAGALATGLVVVVDDEIAIREAMASLLGGWGHQVVTADSGDDAIAQLATWPIRPDLIISDYRLRDGENGIDMVERLRSEYNETIPAMLITGDTAPDRLIEAQASGLLLLHKPVSNSRLRAAIVNLVGLADPVGGDDAEPA